MATDIASSSLGVAASPETQRVIANGSGNLASGASTSAIAFSRLAGEQLLPPVLAGFISGTAVDVGQGGYLDWEIHNTGVTTLTYELVLTNNSPSTMAYEYTILGVTP